MMPLDASAWIDRLASASAQGAILAAAVLAARWALGSRVPPRWWALAWVLVLARFALVAAPASAVSVFNLWSPSPTRALAPIEPAIAAPAALLPPSEPAPATPPSALAPEPSTPAAARPAPTTAPTPWPWRRIALTVWALGVAGLLLAIALAHARLWRVSAGGGGARLIADARVLAALDEARRRHGVRTLMHAAESPTARSPMVFGFIRPVVIFPTGMADRLSDDELLGVMLHEVAHVRRLDIPLAWAASLVLALHWFNPLAWVAAARLRADRELAADALALSVMDGPGRVGYGRTLVAVMELASRPAPLPSLAAVVEGPWEARRRIDMVTRYRRTGRWASIAAGVTLAAIAGVTLTDARPAEGVGAAADAPEVVAPAAATVDWTDAAAILAAVAETYAAFSSYEDTGTVRTKYSPDGRGWTHTQTKPFETSFVRPDLVRYEFRSQDEPDADRYVVWGDATGWRSWWTIEPRVLMHADVSSALGGAIGVSGGSANLTLPLLTGGGGSPALLLNEPRVEGVEQLGAHECVKLSGTLAQGEGEGSVWIDRSSLLIRRVAWTERFDRARLDRLAAQHPAPLPAGANQPAQALEPFTARTVIEVTPRANVQIDRRVFSAMVPEGGK